MAELMVRAWQPSNSIQDIGDIVVVRPDGHEWGTQECLPDYLIVKLPGISVEDFKAFESALMDNDHILHKRKKGAVPSQWVINAVSQNESVITINVSVNQQQFKNAVINKVI